MKTYIRSLVLLGIFLGAGFVYGQEKGSCVTDVILSSYSSRNFNSTPLTKDQINLVLQCGIKSPSARNNQPWKYTVVTDETLAQKIIRDALPGNAVIVVSGPENVSEGMNPDIDCSLTTAYMYVAAQSLGLAAHLYTSPVRNVNENLKVELGIAEGYRAILVLKIGNTDSYVDGISSASARNDLQVVVTFK